MVVRGQITLYDHVEQLEAKLQALQELVEYHLRREPVMDREIYRMQNVQVFGADYWRLKNGS